MKLYIIFLSLIIGFFVTRSSVFAAISLNTSNVPGSIDQSGDFDVDISFSCAGCTSDSYLRGVFYHSGTSYFGYTQNNSGNWINTSGSECTQYFKLAQSDMPEGSWSGKLKVKPDIESSYYNGPGEYSFKVGRYTGSCSATWSNETTLAITGPTPTPTSEPTSTPTPTPINTPKPTATGTPAPTATKNPTPTLPSSGQASSKFLVPTPTPTKEEMAINLNAGENSTQSPEVLGAKEEVSSTAQETPQSRPLIPIAISLLLVSVGLGLLSFVLIWNKRSKRINNESR